VTNGVEFCFDKTLNNQSVNGGGGFIASDFLLGGYRSENVSRADLAQLETNAALQPKNGPPNSCVRAYFNNAGDIHKYSIGTVLAGAVITNGGTNSSDDANNFADSTLYANSDTHNGTSGFSAGPDLTALIVDSTSNTVTYIEDQDVFNNGSNPNDPANPLASRFYFVDAAGNVCIGRAVVGVSGTNVTVSYGGSGIPATQCSNGGTEGVNNAVRAGEFQDAAVSANDTITGNFDDSAVVPGKGTGVTSRPDLTGVTIEANQQAMDFTFDKTVSVNNASNFRADLSTGDEVAGNNASVINTTNTSTTVRVTFPNFSTYDEYVVAGSVAVAAVVEPSGGGSGVIANTPGSQQLPPPWGNAGAFARGFTTGPDAMGGQLNTTTGVLSLTLDQRAFDDQFTSPNNIRLLSDTGDTTGIAGSGSITFPTQPAGQQTITVQFSPGQAVTAHNIEIGGLFTIPNGTTENNSNPGSPLFCQGGNGNTGTTNGGTAGQDPHGCYFNAALYSNLGTGSSGRCVGNDCVDQPNVDQILAIGTTSSRMLHHRVPAMSRKAIAARNARLHRASARRLAALRAKHARQHKRHRRHH